MPAVFVDAFRACWAHDSSGFGNEHAASATAHHRFVGGCGVTLVFFSFGFASLASVSPSLMNGNQA